MCLLLSSGLLGARAAEPLHAEESLAPGATRERAIAAGEAQAYRVVVEPGTSLVVNVEQQSIGLELSISGPGDGPPVGVKAGNDRWGPVVALLDAAGSYRVEVRPRETLIWPGHYAIRVEPLPKAPSTPEDLARRKALDLMSRAGRAAFDPTPVARKRALATYRAALLAWRGLGARAWEAETRSCLGFLEADAGDFTAATGDFQAALALWQELGETRREAEARKWLGVVFSTQDAGKARAALEAARTAWQRAGEPLEEAETRYNLCAVERNFGSLPAALDCLTEVRALFLRLGDDSHEAPLLNFLGGIHKSLGEPDRALAAHEQALTLYRKSGDRHAQAEILNNIAALKRAQGEWQEALRRYGEVREIVPFLGDRRFEGTLLNNIGFTYGEAGLPERERPYLEAALKLRREAGDRRGEITTRNNLGILWRKLGEPKKALAEHRRTLELARHLGDFGQQATSRLRLMEDYLDTGRAAAALGEADAAVQPLAKSGDRGTETLLRYQQGRALLLAGRTAEALPALTEVLGWQRGVHDRDGEAETLTTLAEAERTLGRSTDALAHAREAMERIEELRGAFPNPDLRASFLAQERRTFALLIDLLMDRAGDAREAFAVSERARARSLLDVLLGAGSLPAANTASGELLARRRILLRRLSGKVDERRKQSGERAATSDREIEEIQTDILSVEAAIRVQDPRFAAAAQAPAVTPAEIAGGLGPGTALLEYSLGEPRSFLWVVDARGLRSFVLPGERKIETLARRVYRDLRAAEPGRKAAFDLARMLLGPIWGEAAGLRRLVVVPDGALHVVPFSALLVPRPGSGWGKPESAEPLLLHLEVAYVPSASVLAAERRRLAGRPPAPKLAAVLADPIFSLDDPRLARGGGREPGSQTALRSPRNESVPATLARLPASRREAEAIRGLVPAGQVWVGLGAAARRETVVSGALRDYRVLHFATHAVANATAPELSGLVLSGSFLSLADLYELDLHADLVVLSGCETALGKEVRGEGLMSLTRAFQYAGVPRVVASLWQVEDQATAELMSRFYREMWRHHLPAAAALRAAQRSLYREPRYRAAHAWAAFVLQGDWR